MSGGVVYHFVRERHNLADPRPLRGLIDATQGTMARRSKAEQMTDGTKILMVEDSAQDAEILLHHLRREGLAFHHLRVETERELRAALRDFAPSVVLSDFAMPGFDGMSALAVCRELAPETPFIFVSGHIGEEMAVGAMKAGAADYVMKGNLAKVGPAVTRELKDAAARRERRHAEGALRRAQAMAELAHVVTGPEGDFLSWSETLPALAGLEASEMPKSTRAWLELIHPDDREAFRAASILAAKTG